MAEKYEKLNETCFENWLPDLKNVVLSESDHIKKPCVEKYQYLYIIYLPEGLRSWHRNTSVELLLGMAVLAAFLEGDKQGEATVDNRAEEIFESVLARYLLDCLREEFTYSRLFEALGEGKASVTSGLMQAFYKGLLEYQKVYGKFKPTGEIQEDLKKLEGLVQELKIEWPSERFPRPVGNETLDEKVLFDFPKPKHRSLHALKTSTKEELHILAKDKFSTVRASVAKNENCPKEILEALSMDLDSSSKCN